MDYYMGFETVNGIQLTEKLMCSETRLGRTFYGVQARDSSNRRTMKVEPNGGNTHMRKSFAASLLLVVGILSCSSPTEPAAVATVTVTPNTITLVSGTTTTLTAATLDAKGHVLANRAISWRSSDPSVATVDANGVVTARYNYSNVVTSVTVTAASEGKSAGANVAISPIDTPQPTIDTSTFAVPDTVFAAALRAMGISVIEGRVRKSDVSLISKMAIDFGAGYPPKYGGLWTGTGTRYITNAAGIEHFRALQYLRMENQKIPSIDVRTLESLEFLSLWGNPITNLDLSKNLHLRILGLSETSLTDIDVSRLSALEEVDFQQAPRELPYTRTNGTVVYGFRRLDLSQNHNLGRIYIWGNNLTDSALILSPVRNKITDFWAYNNKFRRLDFSGYSQMGNLVLYNNDLEYLDLRAIGPNYPHVPGFWSTGNTRLFEIRVTSPQATIQARSMGAPIYIDPWTRFVP